MNERIRELISQAQKEVWGNNPYNGSPEFDGYELDAEKFAELIINDCLLLVKNRAGGPYDISMSNETRRTWNIWIELKEHFGIKE